MEKGIIVIYDANPTVREIIRKKLAVFGQIEVLDSPAHLEETLRTVQPLALLVFDISRHSNLFPQLQHIVPKYLPDPNKVILTARNPAELVKYIQKRTKQAFFQHLVERPFKPLEFSRFAGRILCNQEPQICLETQKSPLSLVNSGDVQILAGTDSASDERVSREVDGILSASVIIPRSQVSGIGRKPASPPPIQRISRTGARPTVAGRILREGSISGARSMECINRNTPNTYSDASSSSLASSSSRASDSGNRRLPRGRIARGSARPSSVSQLNSSVQNISILPENHISSAITSPVIINGIPVVPKFTSGGEIDLFPANSSDHAPLNSGIQTQRSERFTVKSINRQGSILSAFEEIAGAEPNEQEEEESTLVVSAKNMNVLLSADSVLSDIVKPVKEPAQIKVLIQLPGLLFLLKTSAISNAQAVIECADQSVTHVMIIDSGRVEWFESLPNGRIMEADEWLYAMQETRHTDIAALLSLVHQNLTMDEAFASLDRHAEAVEICAYAAEKGLSCVELLENTICTVYTGIPEKYMKLLKIRPIEGIDIMPGLFANMRNNADSLIVPPYFKYARFLRRPYRTPLNAGIELTQPELFTLNILETPKTFAELREYDQHRTKGLAELIYRLSLFDLVDFVA